MWIVIDFASRSENIIWIYAETAGLTREEIEKLQGNRWAAPWAAFPAGEYVIRNGSSTVIARSTAIRFFGFLSLPFCPFRFKRRGLRFLYVVRKRRGRQKSCGRYFRSQRYGRQKKRLFYRPQQSKSVHYISRPVRQKAFLSSAERRIFIKTEKRRHLNRFLLWWGLNRFVHFEPSILTIFFKILLYLKWTNLRNGRILWFWYFSFFCQWFFLQKRLPFYR